MREYENVPFDDDEEFDDYRVGGGYADGKTTKQIAEEASFPPVPDGRNLFYIKKVELKRDAENNNEVLETCYEAWTDEEGTGHATTKESVYCKDAIVTWAMIDDPRLSINEYFRLPPDDEDQQEIFARSASREGGKIGMDWNKYRHMISALGFDIVDGSIPEEACTFGSWKRWPDGSPRLVSINIVPQRTKESGYKELKLGANGQPYKQVQMFSHQRSEDTLERLGVTSPADEPEPESAPEPEPAPKPAPKPTAKPAAKPAPAKPAPAATKTNRPKF